jgi:hypothetical protein
METTKANSPVESDSYIRTLKRTLALLDWVVFEEEGRIQAHPSADHPDVYATFSHDPKNPDRLRILVWDAMNGKEIACTTCSDPSPFRAIQLVQQLIETYWRFIELP